MESQFRSALRAISPRYIARLAYKGAGIYCAWSLACEHLVHVEASEGPSMYPTCNARGDVLLVSRLHRNGKGIEVGDFVRFHHPSILGVNAAKRVVGMPGDFVCRDEPVSAEVGAQDMIQVPEGHVFVVGDNLPWSRDSRLYGAIPMGLINGKIIARIWPLSKMEWMRNTMQSVPLDD